MIQKIEVTSDKAYKYIKGQLEKGGKSLSNLLSGLPLENGKVFSFVPEQASENSISNFSSGGLYPLDKEVILKSENELVPIQNDARPYVLSIIKSYLIADAENCCLFEDPYAIIKDAMNGYLELEYISCNGEIYYFFGNNKLDTESLEASFKTSEGYYFTCILSSLEIRKHQAFSPFRVVSQIDLYELLNSINSFFVRAYDGEGYMLWVAS